MTGPDIGFLSLALCWLRSWTESVGSESLLDQIAAVIMDWLFQPSPHMHGGKDPCKEYLGG